LNFCNMFKKIQKDIKKMALLERTRADFLAKVKSYSEKHVYMHVPRADKKRSNQLLLTGAERNWASSDRSEYSLVYHPYFRIVGTQAELTDYLSGFGYGEYAEEVYNRSNVTNDTDTISLVSSEAAVVASEQYREELALLADYKLTRKAEKVVSTRSLGDLAYLVASAKNLKSEAKPVTAAAPKTRGGNHGRDFRARVEALVRDNALALPDKQSVIDVKGMTEKGTPASKEPSPKTRSARIRLGQEGTLEWNLVVAPENSVTKHHYKPWAKNGPAYWALRFLGYNEDETMDKIAAITSKEALVPCKPPMIATSPRVARSPVAVLPRGRVVVSPPRVRTPSPVLPRGRTAASPPHARSPSPRATGKVSLPAMSRSKRT
jgi:hypothetical protein